MAYRLVTYFVGHILSTQSIDKLISLTVFAKGDQNLKRQNSQDPEEAVGDPSAILLGNAAPANLLAKEASKESK